MLRRRGVRPSPARRPGPVGPAGPRVEQAPHGDDSAGPILVLTGLMLGLVIVEVGLLALGPRLPGLYNLATFQRLHPEYGFFHQPGARGWTRSSEFTTYVQINSRGLRDDETAIPKPDGTFRVLVLGDSMVEGAQVALEQTMPKQLTRLLGGGQGGGTRPLDTINAGNAGFGTAQELLFLEREGPSYQPDLVVLVYYVDNDTANNGIAIARKLGLSTAHRPYFDLAADGSLHQVDRAEAVPDTLGRVDDFFRAHSLLYSVGENLLTAKSFAKQYHAMRMGEDAATYKIEATREWRSAWAVTEALLKRARASSDALGAELLVVCAPSQFQLDDEAWEKLIGSGPGLGDGAIPSGRPESAAGRGGGTGRRCGSWTSCRASRWRPRPMLPRCTSRKTGTGRHPGMPWRPA